MSHFGSRHRFQVHYNGYQKPFQEPWCYGADVERVCKRYILLRYELLQLWCALRPGTLQHVLP